MSEWTVNCGPVAPRTAELLGDHDVVEEVRSRPAELRRYIGTQKTRVTGFEPQLARHDTDSSPIPHETV
jgi:hypothetical protein